jgi:hypothetical protein
MKKEKALKMVERPRCAEVKSKRAIKSLRQLTTRFLDRALNSPCEFGRLMLLCLSIIPTSKGIFPYDISTAIKVRMRELPRSDLPLPLQGEIIEWDRSQARVAVAPDGVPMVVYFPGHIPNKRQVFATPLSQAMLIILTGKADYQLDKLWMA